MASLIIRHKVKDFAAWKNAYDAHAGVRSAAGLGPGRVTRSIDDPREVVIIFDAGDVAKAKAFCASEDLKATMQKAGVIDKPDLYFVDDAA